MTVYVQRGDGALVKFEGMTETQVRSLLDAQGLRYTVIDAATYSAALAAVLPG